MKKIFLLLVGVLLLTGCSPYTLTYSEVYNGPELAENHTFRIVTPSEGTLPPGMTMVTYYNIAAAIREQMVERGFTEDPQSPMLVNIALTVRKDLVDQPVTTTVPVYNPAPVVVPGPGPAVPPPGPGVPPPPGGVGTPPPPPPAYNGMVPYFMYPRSYYWPSYATVTQWVPALYREGVLTIDLVDMPGHLPLYSASVATILDSGDSQLRNLEGIAEAVKVLFSKFPVPMLPQYRK